jgi:hypothetical protein
MTRHRKQQLAGILVLAVLGVHASLAAGDAVPRELQPPRGLKLLFRVRAEGVQLYECRAVPGKPKQFEWAPKGPRAELFDDDGQKVGIHYAGPTWEATDGSKVRSAVKKSVKSPAPGAVPWLLLEVTAHEGKGRLSLVKYIQRLDTWAGQPPAATGDKAGKLVSRKYQATYVFYGD